MQRPFAIDSISASILVFAFLLPVDPARAAIIYTFGVTGTSAFDTNPLSFSLDSGPPPEFTFTKSLDSSSDDFSLAVALGSTFAEATFIAFDTVIAPENELFRDTFLSGSFLSWQLDGTVETVSLTARTITRTGGPAQIPEPASLLLLGTGLIGVGIQRWRSRRS